LVAALDAGRETGAVRAAEPGLLLAHHHVDVAELLAELLGKLGGAVRAVVVDDEDVGAGRRRADALEQLADVGGLLVGRHDDQDAHGRRTLLPAFGFERVWPAPPRRRSWDQRPVRSQRSYSS